MAESSFSHSRNAFDQQVPFRKNGHQRQANYIIAAANDAAQRGFKPLRTLVERCRFALQGLVSHRGSFYLVNGD